MISLSIVILILLGIVSIIDWKIKAVPSAFLTGILFLSAMVHFYNFEVGLIHLVFGVLAFIYSWILYEADFIGGVADVKIITIIGLMITNLLMFFVFMILIISFGMIYKIIFRYALKKDKLDLVPFIPCLYVVYIVLWLAGGIA